MSEQSSQTKSQTQSSSTATTALPGGSGPGATERETIGCLALTIGLLSVGAISIATTVLAYFIVQVL